MGPAGRRVTRIPLPGTGSQERGSCSGTAARQEQSMGSKIKGGLQNPGDLTSKPHDAIRFAGFPV